MAALPGVQELQAFGAEKPFLIQEDEDLLPEQPGPSGPGRHSPDNQGPTPVQGDWPVHPATAWAIEGNVKVAVPEWEGQLVQIKLEMGNG